MTGTPSCARSTGVPPSPTEYSIDINSEQEPPLTPEQEAARLAELETQLEVATKARDKFERLKFLGLHRVTDRDRVLLEHGAIAAYLHREFKTVSFNKEIWIYDSAQGIYRKNEGDIEAEIQLIIDSVGFKGQITTEARNIRFILLTINRFIEYPFNWQKDLIPVDNGVLKIDFETGQIIHLSHSPEWMFTYKFPVKYEESADSEEFHTTVISQYLDNDDDDTNDDILYQIPAQALLQVIRQKPYKKAYILQGDAQGGKTTYLEWLTALFGQENIARVSLHQIGKDRFVNGTLEGKILNCCDDLDDVPLENIGPFKKLTGGYQHQIERKLAHAYQGFITATHVFTCNVPPDVPEKVLFDAAFWSRFEYLHFSNIFEVDPGFTEWAFSEKNLSGSFNRVLKTMIKIRNQGLLFESGPSEVKESWQTAADPFKKFITEHMTETEKEHTFPKEPLFSKFLEYCNATNVNPRKIPTTVKGFSTLIFKNRFKEAQRSRKHVYVSHYTWNPNSPYKITDEDVDRGANQKITTSAENAPELPF